MMAGLGAVAVAIVKQITMNGEAVGGLERHRFWHRQGVARKIRQQATGGQFAPAFSVRTHKADAMRRLGVSGNESHMRVISQHRLDLDPLT